jgi:hypothetical protein
MTALSLSFFVPPGVPAVFPVTGEGMVDNREGSDHGIPSFGFWFWSSRRPVEIVVLL